MRRGNLGGVKKPIAKEFFSKDIIKTKKCSNHADISNIAWFKQPKSLKKLSEHIKQDNNH